MIMEPWTDVLQVEGSNEKASLYQRKISGAIESIFPLITVRNFFLPTILF